MQVIHKSITDWENLFIRFVPGKRAKNLKQQIESWILEWSKKRAKLTKGAISSQVPMEYGVLSEESDGTVTIMIGWVCEKSLPVLERFLRERATDLERIEFGLDYDLEEPKKSGEFNFVSVHDKTIEFEDGSKRRVKAFEISKQPILFCQFNKFVEATSYETTNEKLGDKWTFQNNDALPCVGDPSRETTPVTCVSYHDAVAFCWWARLRLPTECELLAAYVLDWMEHESIPDEVWDRELCRAEALENPGPEWTSEYNKNSDSAIVRYGPHYFLQSGWRNVRNRAICGANFTDLCLQFRVCKME